MLRTIKTDRPFRGLHITPFDRDGSGCVLGRQTVIYGRNGSGKTTLSEILRLGRETGSAEGSMVTASVRKDGATSTVGLGALGMTIKVYNRYWVEDSLRLFLSGERHSDPILKLGEVNVTAAADLRRIRSLTAKLEQRERDAEKEMKSLDAERKQIEQGVKNAIIGALASSDPTTYNSARFTVAKSKRLLNDVTAQLLDDAVLTAEISNACEPRVEGVPVPPVPRTPGTLRATVNGIVAAEVESDRIPRLIDDTRVAGWVEDGLKLHTAGDQCAFCRDGTVTSDLLERYRRHFSDALLALRERIERGIEYLALTRREWEEYLGHLPEPEALLVDYRDSISEEKERVSEGVELFLRKLDGAADLLKARRADPLVALTDDRLLQSEVAVPDVQRLHDLLVKNNAECANQEQRKREAQQAVERHFAASDCEDYGRSIARSSANNQYRPTIVRRLALLAGWAHDLEQSQQETGAMARLSDQDLQEHFGHSHLNISVSTDGKGYIVRRGTEVALMLSEGERNAIAFLYFLRSLQEDGIDASKTVVVVDDPVTSLDKEALFAAFAIGDERTKGCAQTIYLTHDYEFFRLLVNNFSSKRATSVRKLGEKSAEERAFPRVSFLEIFAGIDRTDGRRTSSLRALPDGLLKHPSEYHYLFSKVANAVHSNATEELPLLGNAARRLVEGFISFRAPHGNTFQEKVDAIRLDDDHAALSKRVVKFLHVHSHREEPSPVAALDFPSIEAELRSVLDFMRLADEQHFVNMCRAVDLDVAAVSQRKWPLP